MRRAQGKHKGNIGEAWEKPRRITMEAQESIGETQKKHSGSIGNYTRFRPNSHPNTAFAFVNHNYFPY